MCSVGCYDTSDINIGIMTIFNFQWIWRNDVNIYSKTIRHSKRSAIQNNDVHMGQVIKVRPFF